MAHESFEDPQVAKLMNDCFVCIKVDREERPDIDNIYMSVCQMMTGSGGWPLTVVMTPDKKPFYSGTYFPKQSQYGRIGMMELIPRLKDFWDTKRDDVINTSDKITSALQKIKSDEHTEDFNEGILDSAYGEFEYIFDEKHGGFGDQPKFPTPHNLMFLLRYWKKKGNANALDMVLKTLDAMSLGGIFDHIGFGFHRYSTDSKWLVPHFEKMLYDQALIAMAYIEAYEATGKEEYKLVAEKIFEYVLRDMTSKEGGFYSAEDADSEKEEGKFYLWSIDEISEVLTNEDAALAAKIFNMDTHGNFRDEVTRKATGLNIPHLKRPISQLKDELNINEIENRLESIRRKLFTIREKRVRPQRDDKILVDWNGLMIAALSKGAMAFDNMSYAKAAKKAADFILDGIDQNNGVLHRYHSKEWSIHGNIDDYAFLVYGLMELYEATFEVKYLEKSIKLNDEAIKSFWDDKNGGFFFTSESAETILVRQKEIYDGAVPSGNSVSLLNLLKLARITENTKYDNLAKHLVKAFSNSISKAPHAYSQMLIGLNFMFGPTFEVVIAGEITKEDTQNMIKKLRSKFIPNKTIILNPFDKDSSEIHEIAHYVNDQVMIDKKATAYVCTNFACSEPTNDVNEMLNRLQ